mgnify:CR=1 FL=1
MSGLLSGFAALVVVASGAWGRDLEDSFSVPGLDSQLAVELREHLVSLPAELGAERAGRVVVARVHDAAVALGGRSHH